MSYRFVRGPRGYRGPQGYDGSIGQTGYTGSQGEIPEIPDSVMRTNIPKTMEQKALRGCFWRYEMAYDDMDIIRF